MTKIVEAVELKFAARAVVNALQRNSYSPSYIETVLDYYLMPLHEFAQKQLLKYDVRSWIVRMISEKVREKLEAREQVEA